MSVTTQARRDRLTAAQFISLRHSILLHAVVIIAPVAAGTSVYNAIWQPVTVVSHLHQAVANLVQSFILVVVIVIGANLVLRSWLARHVPWAVGGGEPSEADRSALIQLPLRAATWLLTVVSLTTAAITVVSVGVGHTPVASIGIGVGLFLTGFTFAVIVYLQTERALSPLYALALTNAEVPSRRGIGIWPRLLVTWTLGSALPLLSIIAIPLRARTGDLLPVLVPVLYMAIGGLVLGLITTVLAARSVAEPIDAVRTGLRQVGDGDLDVELEVTSPGDLGQLQSGFNTMVTGLRERRTLEDLFGRHVGEDVARHALRSGLELEGEMRRVTALFVDIIGSTSFAENNPPRVVVSRVNELFQIVFDVVSDAGGWINKFEGDGCLCVFGAPAALPDHGALGLCAARTLGLRLSAVGLEVGIGVSSGEVVAGNVGSIARFEYTVMGRPINEAARLTDAAKTEPGHVLAAFHSVEGAGAEADHWQRAGDLELRGLRSPMAVARPKMFTPRPG